MPYKIRGQVDGLRELVSSLHKLDTKVRKKTVRKMCAEAGKLILKRAKSLAAKETGLLRKSLGRKVKVYRSGVAVAVVGPRSDSKFRQLVTRTKNRRKPRTEMANPIKYAHLVEQGTTHSRALPFLRPAIAGQQAALREAMANVVKGALTS